ncbi:hypothetical protein KHM83_14235 [Fusibacter paucivorans]|uniref:Uncharacterized protein n=1 Tax=Fusibacter paucivorans TaxID=76009 RepID=A0ABS5PTX3_9FIRM|nr:hypothetical protein [Fusibacter paucivorans]MBS7527839.1 hypothetical protein [Fusibacter paucivorans]
MQQTSHFNLKLPEYTDVPDIADINDNFTTLDGEVAKEASPTQSGRLSAADKIILNAQKTLHVNTAVNDAYTLAIEGITSMTQLIGVPLHFKATVANSGAATLNINSLGTYNLAKDSSADIETGDIPANAIVTAIWDGSRYQLMNVSNSVTKSAVQTLSNKTLASPVMTGTPTTPTAAAGSNSTQVASTAFVKAATDKAMTAMTAGGTSTALTLSNTAYSTLRDGMRFTFVAPAANNGAATTINLNSLGAKPLYKPATSAPPNLKAGNAYDVWYNSAGDCFFIKASAVGTATAANVLAGKTFSNDDDVELVGTMADRRGAEVYYGVDHIQNYEIDQNDSNSAFLKYKAQASGYYEADSTIIKARVQNLIAKNIKSGVKVGHIDNASSNVIGTFTADATATSADIISGKTAGINGEMVTGSIIHRSNENFHQPSVSQTMSVADGYGVYLKPPAGYYNGDSWVRALTPDLNATNVRAGVDTNLGMVGTFTSDGNLVSDAVLPGYRGYSNGVAIDGTMPNRSLEYHSPANESMAGVLTEGNANTRVYLKPHWGYYDGTTWVAQDVPTLTSGNIKSGVNILNVTGTVKEAKDVAISRAHPASFLVGTYVPGAIPKVIRNGFYYSFVTISGQLHRYKYNTDGTLLEDIVINSSYSDLTGTVDAFDESVSAHNGTNTYRVFNFDGTLLMNAASGAPNQAWNFGCNKYGDNLSTYHDLYYFSIYDRNRTEMIRVTYTVAETEIDHKPLTFIDHDIVAYVNKWDFGLVVKSAAGSWTDFRFRSNPYPDMNTWRDTNFNMMSALSIARMLRTPQIRLF